MTLTQVDWADVDWAVLRRPIIWIVVSFAASATVVCGTHHYSAGVAEAHANEVRRLSSVRGQYLALDDEKRLLQQYYPQYEELARQGRIGEERRLNWIETLREVAARIKLPALRYDIAAQVKHQPDFPTPTGDFEVFASDMTLYIGLYHEEDLLRLLEELERQAAGLFSVSSCQLKRNHESFLPDPSKANLEANCRLRWYTVKLEPKETALPHSRRQA